MGKIGDTLLENGLTDDELLVHFRNAQKEIIEVIERADPSSPYRTYRYQQRLAIEKIIKRLEKKIGRWTKKVIPNLVKAGAKEAAEAIREFDETGFALKFSGVDETTVAVLTDAAFQEFGNTMVALRRNATKALIDKKKLNDKIVEGIIQGSSVARTQNQLIGLLKEKGIEVLKAKNGFGRRFSLESYTNLLVRSQSIAAYNTGAKLQMAGAGRRFAKIPKLRPDIDGPDICNHWEDQKFVDLKDPKQLPPYHPNCRHVLQPVSFAELKAERPDLYKLATMLAKKANSPSLR